MTRLGKENAAERLAAISRGESNGMAHYYVALDGANEGEIKALSDALAKKLSAFVIPTDAFLLPSRNLTPERAALPGGAFDYERFTREVARPFLSKKLPEYGVYNERIRGTVERVATPEREVYIVAGTYALHPEIPDFYDLRVVLRDTPADGAIATYLSAYMIEEFADVLVSDDAPSDDGEETFDGFSLPLSLDGDA